MLNHIIGEGVLLVPQKRVVRAINNALNPFGWSQYRQYNKGNVFEEIVKNPVTIVTEPLKALDREVIQPIYREVIQPVGHALEKIGQGIAKDPLTFIAQAAAVALAPVTAGQSLWALPVIAAASTAAKGGSFEDILTATAISAATAAVGGGFGLENSVGGLITSGMQTGGSIAAGTATFSIAGTSITASTASAIAAAGQGLAMGAVAATGAAIKGQDPFNAALPSLVGTALGFAGNQLAQADFFAPISNTLSDIGKNVSPIVSKAMTGVASAAITGAITGKDMSQVAIASLANTAVSGLVSASNVVADFFRNDQGGITNMGAATQSIVADLLGSVAATVASGGKLGAEMGAQFLANATKTLTPFLNPEFDALATNVQLTYKDAEGKVQAVNNAANAQQGWVNKYNADADKLNSLATEVNDLLVRRDATYSAYNAATTQAEINRLKAEFTSLESQISAKTNEYNALYDTIDDTNASYLQSVKDTEAAQKAYFEVSKSLGTLGSQLSSKMNEASKALTETTAKQIDPTFNAEQYKTINNLGSGVDAAMHYLSVGKDQGLPTNLEAAQTYIDEQKQRLVGDIIKAQGYPSIMYVPKDVYEKTVKMVDTQYGNNLAQLKDATPTNITQWSTYSLGKTLGDYLPKYDAAKAQEAAYERMADIVITPSWYEGQAQKDYKLPVGMEYANQNDIMSGTAKSVTTKSGYTVWVKPTANVSGVQQYDPQTGEIIKKPASDILGTKTFEQMSAAEKMAFLNSIEKATLSTENRAKLVEQAGASAIDDAKRVISTIQGSTLSDDAKNIVSSIVAGVGNVPGMFGTALKYIGYYTDIESIENKGAELSAWSDSFSDLVKSSRSADAKASAENIQLINNSTKGFLDSVSGWAEIIKTEGKEVLSGMLAEEFGEEAAQKGGSLSAMAATWASTAAMGIELGVKKLVGVGVAVDAATSMIESFDGTAKSTEKRLYDAYIAQGMSRELAAEKAKDDSLAPALFSAFVTGAAEGVASKSLVDAVFGSTLDDTAMAMAKRFMSAEAINVLADLSEGGLQGMAEELAVWKVNPNAADISGGVTKGALWEATLGRGMGTTVSGAGLMINLAYAANPAFEAALKSGNYTMGELGAVLNEWTPPVSQTDAVDIRTSLLPQIFEVVPQYAAGYSNANDFLSALGSATGVWESSVLADLAERVDNGKFASQVTTVAEAQNLLEQQGLTNVTADDAIKSGAVGATSSETQNKISTYANQQMVSEAELRAAAAQENYDITAEELSKLVGRGVQADVIAKFVAEVDPKAVTKAEATQYFLDQGYTKARAEDIAQFVKSAPEEAMKTAVAEWVNPRQVTRAEALQFFSQLGYMPSESEIAQYVVQGPEVFQDAIKQQLGEYVDPRYVDATEVREAFKNMGLNAPVAASDVLRLSGQYAETELAGKAKEALPVVSANAMYALMAGDVGVTETVKQEIIAKVEEYKNLNMSDAEAQRAATAAVAAQLGTTKDTLLSALGATEENLVVQIGNTKSELMAKIEEYKNQGLSQAEANAKAVQDVATQLGTTKEDLLGKLGATEQNLAVKIADTRTELLDKIEEYKNLGFTQNQALQKAIDDVSSNLGTTKADLLSQLGATETNLLTKLAESEASTADKILGVQTDIAATKSTILDQMAAYEQAGIDRDTALDLAISGVAQDLGVAKADLLTQMGTSESALRTEIGTAKTELTQDINKVAQLVGKPANQVTQADMDAVNAMIGGTTSTNLAYDTNNDGKIDQTDVTNIQNQLTFQQNQNIQQQVDPNTGLAIYVDTTTGQEVSPPTVSGEQWSPTGIYKVLADQKAQAAATAKAQAAAAKTAQQKSQFGTLMGLLFSAPDAAGQTTTVKTPDPAKINYIYDFSSIFANPSQASMMPSPYGAVNTVMPMQPQQKQQAANQPLFQLASGFAEGGIVGGNDIQVGGGGSIDDLLNILKGNG